MLLIAKLTIVAPEHMHRADQPVLMRLIDLQPAAITGAHAEPARAGRAADGGMTDARIPGFQVAIAMPSADGSAPPPSSQKPQWQ